MPRPSWRAAGGCAFAPDPDEHEIPLWRPEVFPGTVILIPVPEGFEEARHLDPSLMGPFAVEWRDASNRHLVLADSGGDHYLCLAQAQPGRGLAAILPLDAAFDLRIEAVTRLLRRLRGRSAGPLPRALELTPQRRARLIQLLHALDFRLAGAGPRQIAAALLDAEAQALPAIEWKSSATRRKANRLIRDAQGLMNGGYRTLLRGG